MAANDVPLFFFLDPGFLMFIGICAAGYGVWKLIERLRG